MVSNNLNPKIKLGIFFLPFFFISIIILLKILLGVHSSEYREIVMEDGLIEYATAIVLFCSAIFSGRITSYFLKTKQKLFSSIFVVITIGLGFFAFEEISWGQRIFDLEAPNLFSENIQGETNIHNLSFLSKDVNTIIWILIGSIGVFGWMIFSKKKNKIYNLFVTFLIPKWFLTLYFIPPLGYYFIKLVQTSHEYTNKIFSESFIINDDHEIGEFLFSLGILFFMLINYFSNIPLTMTKPRIEDEGS